MAKIEVKNIWAEDLFKWFYDSVGNSGGDGAAVIVCENYKEAANWFIEWFCKINNVQENGDMVMPHPFKKGETHIVHLGKDKFWHPKDEYENMINYHDGNENYMFTDKDIDLGHGDYTFLVREDCIFAFEPPNSLKIIKKYK